MPTPPADPVALELTYACSRGAVGVANRLRDLADQVERKGLQINRTGRTTHTQLSAQILHDVLAGIAALGLDTLAELAATADAYRPSVH